MRRSLLLLLLLLALPAWAGKKPRATLVKLDPATIRLSELKFPELKQPCINWVWAGAVEAMLAHQDVTDLKQTHWVLKAYAGEICSEVPLDFGALKKVVDGDYVLLDGRKINLEVIVTPGTPWDMGYLIRSLRENQPLLMIWRGRPVILTGMEYDEYIYPNNQRMFEARKLWFLDPLGGKPDTFDKATDDPAEITGIFEVRAGPPVHFR